MVLALPNPPSWLSQPPSAFDIVAAYFPETNPKGELRLRPCLVLDLLKGKETGAIACRVAYGTKTLKFHQRKYLDLIIQNAVDIESFGLATATRFELSRKNILDLPWNEEFFGCWSGHHHPHIGTLNVEYAKSYAYLMALRQSNGQLDD